ncbi:Fatty acid metabolism regulator protein [Pirellulimonas nuda]|uniref:Fatty acid metabolism regulator protein n=1 Tax=Pirellulimonas nuda TaxID=2528009 RepID=A0A518D6H0_9BACT|nr:TetR/AcrR family transcriptional regulator [Pirellulimonas nuda]QDU87046.1 Fatty acid metabolism regulator protein [Pirellulimonas nuda]
MSRGETSKPRTRRKDARPGEIVEAAMQEFAEQGFAGARIERIARRAGVAKGTVYLYFKTKDELFEAAVRENISPMFARLGALAEAHPGTAAELLTQVIHNAYAELVDKPQRRVILRVLIAEGARFPRLTAFYHQEIITGAVGLLEAIVRRGVATGEFDQTLALATPQVVMGPALMAIVWKLTFDEVAPLDLKAFAAAHCDLVLNGLRKR